MSTAETWDSYKPTLKLVLNNFSLNRCFEWGVGMSTKTISEHPAVNSLDSVEHNPEWFDKIASQKLDKANLIYEPELNLYYLVQGRYDLYNFIFVDGVVREKCLVSAKSILEEDGIVMLHDAERVEYRPMVDEYKHKFWRDFGHTVVLTDNDIIAYRLEEMFRGVANV